MKYKSGVLAEAMHRLTATGAKEPGQFHNMVGPEPYIELCVSLGAGGLPLAPVSTGYNQA